MKENTKAYRRHRKRRKKESKTRRKLRIMTLGFVVIAIVLYLMWMLFLGIMKLAVMYSDSVSGKDTSAVSVSDLDEMKTDNKNGKELEEEKEERAKKENEYRDILENSEIPVVDTCMEEVVTFALEHNISIREYSAELLELYQKITKQENLFYSIRLKRIWYPVNLFHFE